MRSSVKNDSPGSYWTPFGSSPPVTHPSVHNLNANPLSSGNGERQQPVSPAGPDGSAPLVVFPAQQTAHFSDVTAPQQRRRSSSGRTLVLTDEEAASGVTVTSGDAISARRIRTCGSLGRPFPRVATLKKQPVSAWGDLDPGGVQPRWQSNRNGIGNSTPSAELIEITPIAPSSTSNAASGSREELGDDGRAALVSAGLFSVLALTQAAAVVSRAAGQHLGGEGGVEGTPLLVVTVLCAGGCGATAACFPGRGFSRWGAVAAYAAVCAASVVAQEAAGGAVALEAAALLILLPLMDRTALLLCAAAWVAVWTAACASRREGYSLESCFTPLRAGAVLHAASVLHSDCLVSAAALTASGVAGSVRARPPLSSPDPDISSRQLTKGSLSAVGSPPLISWADASQLGRSVESSVASLSGLPGTSMNNVASGELRGTLVSQTRLTSMARAGMLTPLSTTRQPSFSGEEDQYRRSIASLGSEVDSVTSGSQHSYIAATLTRSTKGFANFAPVEGGRRVTLDSQGLSVQSPLNPAYGSPAVPMLHRLGPTGDKQSARGSLGRGHSEQNSPRIFDSQLTPIDSECGDPMPVSRGRSKRQKPQSKRSVNSSPRMPNVNIEQDEPDLRAADCVLNRAEDLITPLSTVTQSNTFRLPRSSLPESETPGSVHQQWLQNTPALERTPQDPREPARPAVDVELPLAQFAMHVPSRDTPSNTISGWSSSAAGFVQAPRFDVRELPVHSLQTMVTLFTKLSEEADYCRVQQLIAAAVCDVLKCDRVSVFMCEWKTQELWTTNADNHQVRVSMHSTAAGYAALQNRLLNISDTFSEHRFSAEAERQGGFLPRSLLACPITRTVDQLGAWGRTDADRQVIAVIQAASKLSGGFTTEDERVLSLFGKQAGAHLATGQLLQQLRINQNKARMVLELSREIGHVKMDLGAMMARIMTLARQVLTVERASVFLIDSAKDELWSIVTDAETAAVLPDSIIRFPVGVGLAGHVAVTGEMLNIQDVYQCDLFNPEFDRRTGFVTKSTLCVPIKPATTGMTVGVLQFINKTNGDVFRQEDEELALTFSSFVGISVNNVILYDELAEGQLVKEQNQELRRLRAEAEQAAEAKSNFLMAMSHEIRTPMSGVIGMCELLASTPLTEEQREMNDVIRNSGDALLAIINDVLDYGKIGAGKLELEMREFDPIAMLDDAIDVLRCRIEPKDITVTLDIAPDFPQALVGDQFRLRQVVLNLLGNACKFTPSNGSIGITVQVLERPPTPPEANGSSNSAAGHQQRRSTVKLSRPPEPPVWVRFALSDTGIGISEEAKERLFSPFEQADAGTTRQYGGTGLGLAICLELVTAMHGRIGIDSVLGEGSTFWFYACFGEAEAEAKRAPISAAVRESHPDLFRAKVLVACSHATQGAVLMRFFNIVEASARLVEDLSGLRKELGLLPAAARAQGWVPTAVLIDERLRGCSPEDLAALLGQIRSLCGSLKAQGFRSPDEYSVLNVAMLTSLSYRIEHGPRLHELGVGYFITTPPKNESLAQLCLLGSGQEVISPPGLRPQVHTEEEEGDSDSGEGELELRLLVAEDNKTNQLLIKKQMGTFGITPTVCDNGQLAVEALLRERYDLVLMDCHMPVLDGYGATHRIRELEKEGRIAPPRVVIVALTADALPNTRQDCLDAGMDDYATKPLRKAQLGTVLDKYWFSRKGSRHGMRSFLNLSTVNSTLNSANNLAMGAAHSSTQSSGNPMPVNRSTSAGSISGSPVQLPHVSSIHGVPPRPQTSPSAGSLPTSTLQSS
eukprot:TRINITY_DN19995_c1_g1_i3.p1 TRINITY_DN19995_c1_g1~~TRINITY_DN19995_c1_g1_i3.p1  ORF type:complete len:1808 (+),score=344.85 TRINITY_DN19995_c1_g1_i3:98-5425(+)